MSSDALLTLTGVSGGYEDLEVVRGVSFTINSGDLIALIGPNGAGKTTLLRTIAGLNQPIAGKIEWEGRNVTRLAARQRAQVGITLVPEGRHLFPGLTVGENLELGASGVPRGRKSDVDIILDLFPELQPLIHRSAGALSGGEQQMCAVGRGLMARPQLLMIDELSLGLAPVVASRLLQAIERVHGELNMAVLFVEQDADVALRTAERALVLSRGRLVLQGPAKELRKDQEAIERAFLGLIEEPARVEPLMGIG